MKTLAEHLLDRHFDVSRYTSTVDEEDQNVSVLLWNLSGQAVGYHQYRPDKPKEARNDPKDARYYTYLRHKKERRISMFGLETLHYSPGILFLTEGIFDACRFHNAGYSACATLSNDPKHLTQLLWILSFTRLIVAVCDDDPAGKKLAKHANVSFNPGNGNDCGDLSEDEFKVFLNKMLTELVDSNRDIM